MFERYTERARRVIFFARYESSQFGATTIESEHLLLGLLREDQPRVASFLRSPDSAKSISREVAEHSLVKEKISTSLDLPLSLECKRALAYAAEEAERLAARFISTEHLLLGLLREEKGWAAKLLRQEGADIAAIREVLADTKSGKRQPVRGRTASAIPVFHVADVVRAAEWYRDVLGFQDAAPFGFGAPSAPNFMILSRDDVEIMLQQAGDEAGESRSASKAAGEWHAYFRVFHLQAMHAEFQANLHVDLPIVVTAYGWEEFTVTDPDGHVLVFSESLR